MEYLRFKINGSEEAQTKYLYLLSKSSQCLRDSSDLLLRCLQLMAPPQKTHHFGVVYTLSRHIAEEVDAISALVAQGCVEPCHLHLRSAFEADLGVRYILQEDSERRGLAYHVKEARNQLELNEKCDLRTAKGKRVREAIEEDPIGSGILKELPPYNFDKSNSRLRNLLDSPVYQAINAEWEKKGRGTTWHSLFGGPRSIRDLAYSLNRAFWYEFLYSEWSGRVHAGRTLRNTSKDVETDHVSIRPLRHPENLKHIFNFGVGMSVDLTWILAKRFLSEQIGQDDIRQLYLQKIQPIQNDFSKLIVRADWRSQ